MVDSRDDIAMLVGCPATAFVSLFNKLGGIAMLLWLIGHLLGFFSFVKVLNQHWSIASPLLTTPTDLYLLLRTNRYMLNLQTLYF